MCFSAEASFGASAIISTIGIVSINKSTTIPQKVISCMPLIFGIQQFTEGILWLSLSYPAFSQWNNIATYAFLMFAQVVWPVFLPLSVLLLEKEKIQKNILIALLVSGILFSSYLTYCLIFYKAQASISCYHIRYEVDYPIRLKFSGIFYFIFTVFPLLLSGIKRLRLLGVVMLLSFFVTKIFYEYYLISVWCFMAAIISSIVLSAIIKLNSPPQPLASYSR